MLSSILNSPKAIETNILIIRSFVYVRSLNISHKDLGVKIKELELKYDKQFDDIFEVINYLLKKDSLEKQTKERGKIGYRKK
jgi:hypothetical protein